jgi:hypothetical protein
VGVVLGYLLHWLDHWIPDIEWAWSLGLAFGLGFLGGKLGIRLCEVRHAVVAGLLGVVAGALGLASMQYFSYRNARESIERHARRWTEVHTLWALSVAQGQAKPAPAKPVGPVVLRPQGPKPVAAVPTSIRTPVEAAVHEEIQAGRLKPGDAAPGPAVEAALDEALGRFGFWQYLQWRTEDGVPLALPRVRGVITITGFWAWIYWLVELALVGGIAGACFAAFSAGPACNECDAWMTVRKLGRLNLDPARAGDVFRRGAVMELAGEEIADPKGSVLLKVYVCPTCGAEQPIAVQVIQLLKGENDKENEQELTEPLAYPGDVLPVLEVLSTPAPPEPEEPPS